MLNQIIQGDVLAVLRTLPGESVHCCVTSIPYWGLRDYKLDPQIWDAEPECEHKFIESEAPNGNGTGTSFRRDREAWFKRGGHQPGFCVNCGAWKGSYGLEPTIDLYVKHSVDIFQEVKRVLRKDGSLWLNIGDCYATGAGKVGNCPGGGARGKQWAGFRGDHTHDKKKNPDCIPIGPMTQPNRMPQAGLKAKELCMMPARVALALQAAGWWLRQDIIWSKPNPMPESVRDRCTKAHEYIFLLSKSERYFFDQEAIKEPCAVGDNGSFFDTGKTGDHQLGRAQKGPRQNTWKTPDGWDTGQGSHGSFHKEGREAGHTGYLSKSGNKERKPASSRGVPVDYNGSTNGAVAGSIPWEGVKRNKRSVWTVATEPFPEAHFATFPEKLIEPCIKAGCPEKGIVLDPFMGAGTTAIVSRKLNRNYLGIELNPQYIEIAERRIEKEIGLLFEATL